MLRKHQGIAHNKPYTVPATLVLLSDQLQLKAVGKDPLLNHSFKELATVDSGVSIQVLWNTSDTLRALSTTSVATLQFAIVIWKTRQFGKQKLFLIAHISTSNR